MKITISAAVAAGLVVGFATSAQAAPSQQYRYPSNHVAGGAYASATARQRHNSQAFDRGQYYERISNEHVFGSRSWWMLKDREGGGGRR